MKHRYLYTIALSISAASATLSASDAVLDTHYSLNSDQNNYPLIIKAVNGKRQLTGTQKRYFSPGSYTVTLQTTKPTLGTRQPSMKSFTFDPVACTKYTFTAQHDSRLNDDWNLRIIKATQIPGCNTEDNKA